MGRATGAALEVLWATSYELCYCISETLSACLGESLGVEGAGAGFCRAASVQLPARTTTPERICSASRLPIILPSLPTRALLVRPAPDPRTPDTGPQQRRSRQRAQRTEQQQRAASLSRQMALSHQSKASKMPRRTHRSQVNLCFGRNTILMMAWPSHMFQQVTIHSVAVAHQPARSQILWNFFA